MNTQATDSQTAASAPLTASAAATTSVRDMVKELNTELSYRNRAYPRWVGEGKMTQANADRRIGVLVAIIAKLQPEADAERDAEAAAKEAEEPHLL